MKRTVLGLVFGALATLMAFAHEPLVDILKIAGITVVPGVDTVITIPYLPYTVFVEGVVTHDGEGNLNTLNLWGTDNGAYFYGPANYFKNLGNVVSAPYSIPWTITSAGPHSITVGANHPSDLNANCPAAPALANSYLKENDLNKKNSSGTNVISAVAQETGKDGLLWAKEKCSAGYAAATISFVVDTLGAE